jgi:hypothetical protein
MVLEFDKAIFRFRAENKGFKKSEIKTYSKFPNVFWCHRILFRFQIGFHLRFENSSNQSAKRN